MAIAGPVAAAEAQPNAKSTWCPSMTASIPRIVESAQLGEGEEVEKFRDAEQCDTVVAILWGRGHKFDQYPLFFNRKIHYLRVTSVPDER
jgi:hypothetical protein